MLFRRIKVGDPLPSARMAILEDGEVSTLSRAGRHLPNVLAHVERLRRSGIDRICILARNDTWVMAVEETITDFVCTTTDPLLTN